MNILIFNRQKDNGDENQITINEMGKIEYLFTFLFFLSIIIGCSKDESINDSNENSTIVQDGTIEHPYLIKTKQDLIQMRDSVNIKNAKYGNKVFKLIADLDFKGESNWVPIGASVDVSFQGVFDGNGKIIKNIKIGSDQINVEMDYSGLFGYVAGGDLKNISVQWIRINTLGKNFKKAGAGGIVGYATGTEITNCNTSGAISSNGSTGGIAGFLTGSHVSECYSTGEISGNTTGSTSGGIVGSLDKSYIIDCYSTGIISGGGIAGYTAYSTINKCYSSGSNQGGIAQTLAGGIILNCFSKANSSGGGIVQYLQVGTLCNCFSSKTVTSSELNNYQYSSFAYSGGIVGIAFNEGDLDINIINCYSSSVISATFSSSSSSSYAMAGGIIGFLMYPSEVSILNCLALNSNVTAISATNNAFAARITNYFNTIVNPKVSNNYATTSMIVKKGRSESTLEIVTDFSNIKKNGTNLTGTPVDLLNKYIIANPTYEGISLLKWKVVASINNGYPVFEN